jgi:hypothetical protein
MKTSLMLSALALFGLASVNTAHALILVSSGNTPGGDNVLFNNNPPDGLLVEGVLNQNSINFDVNFSSTQMLHGNGGQARVEAANGGDLNNICIFLDAGLGFTQFVANPISATPGSTLTVLVESVNSNGISLAPVSVNLAAGNGNNFFTVLGTNGDLITKVCLSGTNFDDLRQNRIGGAQSISTPTGVPEPGAVAMMVGMSIPGLLIVRRKRRTVKK